MVCIKSYDNISFMIEIIQLMLIILFSYPSPRPWEKPENAEQEQEWTYLEQKKNTPNVQIEHPLKTLEHTSNLWLLESYLYPDEGFRFSADGNVALAHEHCQF